jgi:hypothetical protein
MAVHHGKNGKVKLTDDVVAEVTKFSINESVSASDTTAMRSSSQTHITGIPGWTVKIEGNYDPADADGQNVLTIGASVALGLYSDGDAVGKKYFSGTASIVGKGTEASFTDRVTFSVDLQGNGDLDIATVPA